MKTTLRSILLFILFLLALPIGNVFATVGGTLNSSTFYCDAVVVNFATFYSYELRVYDGPNPATDNLLGSVTTVGDFGLTAYTEIIPLNPSATSGTTLYIFLFDGAFDITASFTGTGAKSGACSGQYFPAGQIPAPPAYRQFGGVGARAGVFIVDENNGANNPVLTIYDINENSQGTLLFYISLNALQEQYPADGGKTILIYRNSDEFLSFYRLASGELQINLGPDAEGKMHVIRFNWDGSLPTDVVYDTYFVFSATFPRIVALITAL